jgi:hypothetical protein
VAAKRSAVIVVADIFDGNVTGSGIQGACWSPVAVSSNVEWESPTSYVIGRFQLAR